MKTRHFVILILALLFGLLLHELKGLGRRLNDPHGGDKLEAINLKNFDASPFHVTEKEMHTERQRMIHNQGGFHLAGQPQLPQSYDFSEGHTAAENVLKDAAAKATDEMNKKKKKKHARGKKKDDEKKDAIADNDRGNSPDSKNPAKGNTDSGGPTAQQLPEDGNPDNDNNKLPVTYEDWAKLILGGPHPQNVEKLIQFFKSGMVSGEIFYALLQAMMEESNSDQHGLAIYAAGSVPNPQSFEFLVAVLKSESQGSSLAEKANDYLASYENLKNLNYLKTVISNHIDEAAVIRLAVDLLEKSTQSYIQDQETRKPSADSTTSAEHSKIHTATVRMFTGFEPLLEHVLKVYSSHNDITNPAQKALARIKTLVPAQTPTKT